MTNYPLIMKIRGSFRLFIGPVPRRAAVLRRNLFKNAFAALDPDGTTLMFYKPTRRVNKNFQECDNLINPWRGLALSVYDPAESPALLAASGFMIWPATAIRRAVEIQSHCPSPEGFQQWVGRRGILR
jgi:hypothetical protein